MATPALNLAYCIPEVPADGGFNQNAVIPFGVTTQNVQRAMLDFIEFLTTVNSSLVPKGMDRLEDTLMPANFSSIVGEFVTAAIPRHCPTVVKNTYHNGHPDILPAGKYPNNKAQHAGADGIEVKASRYLKGWQGHNAEDCWIIVFVFESGRPADAGTGVEKKPFRFLAVYGAMIEKIDWNEQPRSATSRRTATASILGTGFAKMAANWIYKAPDLNETELTLVTADLNKG